MIDLPLAFIQAGEVHSRSRSGRISVLVKVRRQQSRIVAVPAQILGLLRISVVYDRVIEIHHLHGDSVLCAVNRLDRCEVVVRIDRSYHRKVEILRLIDRAGHDMPVFRLESRECIAVVVPCGDRRRVPAVTSSVHVQSDRIS